MSKETLDEIHRRVSRNFRYKTDERQYGKLEHWTLPTGPTYVGDCEDFSLICRQECRKAGLKSRLIVCREKRTGEGHCVLECDGYILDNRFEKVLTLAQAQKEYEWHKASGFEDDDEWRRIDGVEAV